MTDPNYVVYTYSLLNRPKGSVASSGNYNCRSVKTIEAAHG
uniref:Uncharacterized protein n=1 Tax=Candidatus Methanogaster sp. ANME-2c ERB4 TaxID=2759911 RepID=A0A7G9YMG6_9EURY|nr:hypothetical protein CJINKJJD_00022 [Methanosarcinales archaeon ANME-2c ERB4]QNO49200.1 hypothetical protein DHJJDJHP_00007 [Methanosarcinales archaeon ANME-2c ERB4]